MESKHLRQLPATLLVNDTLHNQVMYPCTCSKVKLTIDNE